MSAPPFLETVTRSRAEHRCDRARGQVDVVVSCVGYVYADLFYRFGPRCLPARGPAQASNPSEVSRPLLYSPTYANPDKPPRVGV
eukprot:4177022-Lingulodinium_polyedra.AAC.1